MDGIPTGHLLVLSQHSSESRAVDQRDFVGHRQGIEVVFIEPQYCTAWLDILREGPLPDDAACPVSSNKLLQLDDHQDDSPSAEADNKGDGASDGGTVRWSPIAGLCPDIFSSVPGISAVPHDDNLRYFDVMIHGPSQSPYEGLRPIQCDGLRR